MRALPGPVTAGVFRPAVVLPRGLADRLDPAGLRDVLVHEVAHAVRRDGLVGLLQRVAALAFWPHPLVHRLNRRLSRAREEACDDVVLGLGDPARYARTLLHLAETLGPARPGAAVGLFEADWRLEDRVSRLLDPSRPSTTRPNRRMTLAAAFALATSAVAVAAVRPVSETQEPKREVVDAKPAERLVVEPLLYRGQVVDEQGAPVAGALVTKRRWHGRFVAVRSGADGGFVLPPDQELGWNGPVEARTNAGDRIGMAIVEADRLVGHHAPSRVVLKPARSLAVRVRDGDGKPVAGAGVSVDTLYAGMIDPASTDEKGVARFVLAADAEVKTITALKAGVGIDYFENYKRDRPRHYDAPPPEVTLTLDGAGR